MNIASGVVSCVIVYACRQSASCSAPKRTIARALRTLKGEGPCVRASVTMCVMRSFAIGVSLERLWTERRDAMADEKGVVSAIFALFLLSMCDFCISG